MKTIIFNTCIIFCLFACSLVMAVGEVTVFYKDGTSQVYKQIDTVEESYNKRGDLELIRLIPFSRADNEIVIRYEEVKYYQADRFRVDIRKNKSGGGGRGRGGRDDVVYGGGMPYSDETAPHGNGYANGYNGYGYFVKMSFAPMFFNDGNGYFRNDRYVYIRTPANFYIDRGWFIDNSNGTIFLGDQNGRGWIYQIVSDVKIGKDDYYSSKEFIDKVNHGW